MPAGLQRAGKLWEMDSITRDLIGRDDTVLVDDRSSAFCCSSSTAMLAVQSLRRNLLRSSRAFSSSARLNRVVATSPVKAQEVQVGPFPASFRVLKLNPK